jgi:hypothetical protein
MEEGRMKEEHDHMMKQIQILTSSQSAIDYAKIKLQVNGLAKDLNKLDRERAACMAKQSQTYAEIFGILRDIQSELKQIYKDGHRSN